MTLRQIFSDRLKKTRIERGLSQQSLADAIGVSKATISKYESAIHPPKLEHARDLASALNISFNYLIGFSEHRYIIEAQHIVDLYVQLSDLHKKELYNFAQFLHRKEQDTNEGND